MTSVKKWGFLWSYSLIMVILGSYYLGNFTYAGAVYVYLGIPLLDALFGKDRQNVSHDTYDAMLNDRFFDVLVYSFVYLQIALLVWGSYIIATDPLTPVQVVGLTISLGLFGGTIINVAHELGHRGSHIAQWHSKFALATVCYMHFFIEHNRGHHVHVATPRDPATSRQNQTVYSFWWQSIIGSYRSAWQIERRLLDKAGHSVWSRYNDMLWFAFWPVIICSVLTLVTTIISGQFGSY